MPSPNKIFDNLDDAQKAIVDTLEGPVVIYAGAGSGKTRALTHRIANGVLQKIYEPNKVLAVTFTTRAADEMALRLSALGVRNIATRTFHSAALRQLKYFWPTAIGGEMPIIIENKYKVLGQALASKSTNIREFVSVIEQAKTNRLDPDSLTNIDHASAYQSYIEFTDKNNLIDFEDVLMLLVAILEDRPDLADEVHQNYQWLSVDEYQDVNPLQQRLLELWLGENTNVCVVGDSAQTIYTFAGASAKPLENFTSKFPDAAVFKLNRNYRSRPQILEYANKFLQQMPTAKSTVTSLLPTKDDGAKVEVLSFINDTEEAQWIAQSVVDLLHNGAKETEIAVLARINSQLELVASSLQEIGVDYWIQTGERYSIKNRLEPKITLATIHSTKGLEWENLFVMGASDGFLPFVQADSAEEIAEELRLFYVAITRAREKLFITWSKSRNSGGKERIKSRFLTNFNKIQINNSNDETSFTPTKERQIYSKNLLRCTICDKALVSGTEIILKRCKSCPSKLPVEYLEKAQEWRKEQSQIEDLPEFLIFSDASLAALIEALYEVKDEDDCVSIPGIGTEKYHKYIDDLTTALANVETVAADLINLNNK
jgi:superfamily I DNA/RNA helicase